MRIYEAYDNPSIRLAFKKYIEAEGVSVTKREQIYTRFSTYISRIRGVLYDRLLLNAKNENDFKDTLKYIFYEKWKEHLGYPEIPDYFFRYLDFLHTMCSIQDDLEVNGLSADSECEITDGILSRYEERFVSHIGKLRILANPRLIRELKDNNMWRLPVADEAISLCDNFYKGTPISMSCADWVSVLESAISPHKHSKRRGDISFEIKDEDGNTKVYNSFQAMEKIADTAGIDKIAQCSLKLNGQPIAVRRLPSGKASSFKDMGNGYFLNNTGSVMDRFKVMRILVSIYHLPFEINLSKENAVKSPRKTKKVLPIDKADSKLSDSVKERSEMISPENVPHTESLSHIIDDDFVYGRDGVLNLFGDM